MVVILVNVYVDIYCVNFFIHPKIFYNHLFFEHNKRKKEKNNEKKSERN